MSYIHCGNRACDFSQDDWWSKRYNPLTILWANIWGLVIPKWTRFDQSFADQIYKEHGLKLRMRKVERQDVIMPGTLRSHPDEKDGDLRKWQEHQVFTWSLLRWEFYRAWIKFNKMKWWTYEQYKKDPEKLCPKCGQFISSSCID